MYLKTGKNGSERRGLKSNVYVVEKKKNQMLFQYIFIAPYARIVGEHVLTLEGLSPIEIRLMDNRALVFKSPMRSQYASCFSIPYLGHTTLPTFLSFFSFSSSLSSSSSSSSTSRCTVTVTDTVSPLTTCNSNKNRKKKQ